MHTRCDWRGPPQMKAENVPGPSTPADYKMEDEEFGDDEDDDDDMEEVSWSTNPYHFSDGCVADSTFAFVVPVLTYG